MPLLPDKPNPPVPSIAQPDAETRRCTKCLKRKPHSDFRWLWENIRKASACKDCEAKQRRARRATDGKLLKASDRFGMPDLKTKLTQMEDTHGSLKDPEGHREGGREGSRQSDRRQSENGRQGYQGRQETRVVDKARSVQ